MSNNETQLPRNKETKEDLPMIDQPAAQETEPAADPSLAKKDKKLQINDLIEMGRAKGKLTTQEIMDALAAHHLADRLDESVRVLNSVRPDFLQAAMDAACSVSGNLDAYLEQVLHVTPEKQETLRARYLA